MDMLAKKSAITSFFGIKYYEKILKKILFIKKNIQSF